MLVNTHTHLERNTVTTVKAEEDKKQKYVFHCACRRQQGPTAAVLLQSAAHAQINQSRLILDQLVSELVCLMKWLTLTRLQRNRLFTCIHALQGNLAWWRPLSVTSVANAEVPWTGFFLIANSRRNSSRCKQQSD